MTGAHQVVHMPLQYRTTPAADRALLKRLFARRLWGSSMHQVMHH